MAPRLHENALSEIVAIVEQLSPEIAVRPADVLSIAAIVCERNVSRQTIWNCEAVGAAIALHKERHASWRAHGGRVAAKPPLETARETIRKLREEIAARDKLLDQYLEMLARYMKNARDQGIKPDQLERPLPKIHRGAKRQRRTDLQ